MRAATSGCEFNEILRLRCAPLRMTMIGRLLIATGYYRTPIEYHRSTHIEARIGRITAFGSIAGNIYKETVTLAQLLISAHLNGCMQYNLLHSLFQIYHYGTAQLKQ